MVLKNGNLEDFLAKTACKTTLIVLGLYAAVAGDAFILHFHAAIKTLIKTLDSGPRRCVLCNIPFSWPSVFIPRESSASIARRYGSLVGLFDGGVVQLRRKGADGLL